MTVQDIDDNSGVEAILGFEFQRNCALLLLLDNYKSYKDINYFISIEHYDDFVFGFRNPSNTKIQYLKSYQAKKLTEPKWSIPALAMPTSKMLDVGTAIKSDLADKTADFKADLIFVSDSVIELKSENLNKDTKEKARYDIERIRIDNPYLSFNKLPETLKNRVISTVSEVSSKKYNNIDFDCLAYEWVDLPKTPRNQLAILETRVNENFHGTPDPKAALHVLLSLFKDIETTHNKRQKISLMDKRKILEGHEIRQAVTVIDLERRTLDFWRSSSEKICPKLKIPISKSNRASEYIGIAFELFKDKSNQEHKKIHDFVRDNNFEDNCYTSADAIEMFVKEYYQSPILSNVIEREEVVFAIVCAYVQTRDIII